MTPETAFSSLIFAALSLGALHALAPDHWLPFAAVGRARAWSSGRVMRVTLACGLAHLGATALLALGGLWLGAEVSAAFGSQLAATAGLLLVGAGLTYAVWRWRRIAAHRIETAAEDDPSRLTAGTLFVLFALDPCVALIPLVLAAAALGPGALVAVGVTYGIATLGTMTLLVLAAHRSLSHWRPAFAGRWGDVLAGLAVAAAGAGVALLGI